MKLCIVCGIGFSRKSILSKAISERLNDCVVISVDEYYLALARPVVSKISSREYETPQDLSKEMNGLLWDVSLSVSFQAIKDALKTGKSVVFDDVSLLRTEREIIKKIAKESNASPVVIYLDAPVEIARARQETNKISKVRHDVDESSIEEAIKIIKPPEGDKASLVFKHTDNITDWIKENIKDF